MSYVFQPYPAYVRSSDGKRKAIVHSDEERDAMLASWTEPVPIAAPPAVAPEVAPAPSVADAFNGANPAAFDHDGDGNPGGSVAVEQTDDVKALRAEYQAKFNKKPFHGWDASALKAKLAS